jgi:hypothetical protein
MVYTDNEIQVKIDLAHGPATSRKKTYGGIADDLIELVEKWQGRARIRLSVGSYRYDNSGSPDD